MRVLLVYNPTAGGEGIDVDELVALIEREGHNVEAQSIKDDDWKDALTESVELVVAAGGDGTSGKVFKEVAGSAIPVTVLPVGSANNISRSLEIEEGDAARLIRGWPSARRRWFDVGSLALLDGGEPFVESAGGGLFGEVLARAEASDDETRASSKVDFGLRLLGDAVHDVRAQHWEIDADEADRSGEFLAVEVMNVRELGPNIPLAPEADPSDGLLELTLVREADRPTLATYVDARLDDATREPPTFEVHRVRSVVLRPPEGCAVHRDDKLVDSDNTGILTVGVDSGLEVLVPR